MWDYHLYVGFVHSDTLRWSYGSIKGREEDKWNKNVSEMNYGDMVRCLKEQAILAVLSKIKKLPTTLFDTA